MNYFRRSVGSYAIIDRRVVLKNWNQGNKKIPYSYKRNRDELNFKLSEVIIIFMFFLYRCCCCYSKLRLNYNEPSYYRVILIGLLLGNLLLPRVCTYLFSMYLWQESRFLFITSKYSVRMRGKQSKLDAARVSNGCNVIKLLVVLP